MQRIQIKVENPAFRTLKEISYKEISTLSFLFPLEVQKTWTICAE